MPAKDDLPVALERLVALGQSPDINIRPVLLRVLVDMFVGKPHHAPSDVAQFEAIVLHLLDDADVEARLIVAEKLSRHPATPKSLLDRFVAEQGAIASKVYEHADLDEGTLTAAAKWGTPAIAQVVARRLRLPAPTIAALAERPEPDIALALAGNAHADLERPIFQQLVRRAREDLVLAVVLAGRQAHPMDMAPLFPIVGPDQRQAIIEAARRLELGRRQWGRLDGATTAILAHLDRLVLCGERDGFETALSLALGIDGHALAPLLRDEGGEILALALAAVGASADQAARVFILGDPRIGRSVRRVRALVRIVETVSAHAARRLITAMTGQSAETGQRPSPTAKQAVTSRRTEPLTTSDAAQARRDAPLPAATRRHG